LMYSACFAGETPSSRSGGFVWYPYSVSQMRVRLPNAFPTSAISVGSVAIVSVEQCVHPPEIGVSAGVSGYGLCAYASSFAWAYAMPRLQVDGETPPVAARGAVTPPATSAPFRTPWIAMYAGFSSRTT